MAIELDFTPDLVGIWWKGKEERVFALEDDFGVFLMYLGREDSTKGKTIDKVGLANILEYSRTPIRISFKKQYFQSFSNALTKPMNYFGKGGKNFYHGMWKSDNSTGLFYLGDNNCAMKADNPVARSFIRYETTRLIGILKEMHYNPNKKLEITLVIVRSEDLED